MHLGAPAPCRALPPLACCPHPAPTAAVCLRALPSARIQATRMLTRIQVSAAELVRTGSVRAQLSSCAGVRDSTGGRGLLSRTPSAPYSRVRESKGRRGYARVSPSPPYYRVPLRTSSAAHELSPCARAQLRSPVSESASSSPVSEHSARRADRQQPSAQGEDSRPGAAAHGRAPGLQDARAVSESGFVTARVGRAGGGPFNGIPRA